MSQDTFRKLDVIGTKYFQDSLIRREEKKASYGKKRVAVGVRKSNKKVFYLDLSDAIRAVVIGRAGSGKTFLLRGLADRTHKAGYSILFLPDVKNEFHTSNQPVQEKFHHLLLPHERPEGMPVLSFRPTFFMQTDKSLPEDNYWYSPHIAQISKADFFTLIGAHDMPPMQQVTLELLYTRLMRGVRKNPRVTFELLKELLDDIDLHPGTKASLQFKFSPLKDSHMIVEEHIKNPIRALQEGYSVALNLENFDQFGRTGFNYHETLMSIVFRTLIHARRAKKISPFVVILDECSRFVHAEKRSSFRDQVEESVDVDRRYGVSLIFGTQELKKLPEVILRQCRYIFVPYSADVGTLRDAMMLGGLFRNQQVAVNATIRLKGRLEKHDWVVIDMVEGVYDIVVPAAPLSAHKETAE